MRMTKNPNFFLFRLLVMSCFAVDCPWSTTLASVLPLSPRKKSATVDDSNNIILLPWIKSRTAATASLDQYTNGQPASLWLYQGSLMDPLTGKVLARVEGFEVVTLQGLWKNQTGQTTDSSTTSEEGPVSYVTRLPPSPVANWTRTLFQQHNTNIQAAATWESRKVFLYREADKSGELLAKIRLRPAGPQRKVPLNQAISTWHATTTVVQTDNTTTMASGRLSSDNNNKNNVFFFGTALTMEPQQQQTTRPTLIWNTAPVTWEPIVSTTTDDKKKRSSRRDGNREPTLNGNLEFTIHARPRRGSQEAAIQRHFTAQTASTAGLSPPRSAIVSLGGNTNEASISSATSAHETYRYHLPSGRVSYSRYGEGPVWYGPQRPCRLEMRGQVQSDFSTLSPVLQELVRRLATTPTLTVEALFPEEVRARQVAEEWPIWHKQVRWLQPYWQRVVQATSVQPLPSKEW